MSCFSILLLASAAVTDSLSPAARYGFTFFRGNGEDGVFLATSADGLNWKEANGGKPILPATLGDRITRDPSVCVGPDGLYHMVFTTSWVNQGFGVTHSPDLFTWSKPEFVPVNDDWPEAKNTWAPEISWDADSKRYFVVWATSTTTDPKTRYHRQYYVATADFKSWTHRALYYDPGHSVIDCFPFRFEGRWMMLVKDETHEPVAHYLQVVRSRGGAFGPWEKAEKPFTDKDEYWAEGPTALELDDGRWIVYFDRYREHRYGALVTRDFVNFKETVFNLPAGIRHGTTFRLRR